MSKNKAILASVGLALLGFGVGVAATKLSDRFSSDNVLALHVPQAVVDRAKVSGEDLRFLMPEGRKAVLRYVVDND